MIFILLSALASISILFIFRYLERYKSPLIYPIVVNYITAFALGAFVDYQQFDITELHHKPWFFLAIFIGFMLIVMFFIIGTSSQKAGLTPTSVASKMSVAIPMTFAILYFHEDIYPKKIMGIILALVAVVLAVWKKSDNKKISASTVWLPIVLFFGAGLIDSLIQFSQRVYLDKSESAFFTGVLFGFSFLFGIILIPLTKNKYALLLKKQNLIGGMLLGIANFGSIFFLILALKNSGLDNSVVFGLNNVLVVIFAALAGLMVFKEKLNKINWIGYILAFVAIYLLSYSNHL